jgi:hypothetical protein
MRPSILIAIVAGASLVVALAIVIFDDDDDGGPRITARERASYGDDEDDALRAYSKRQVALRKAKVAAAASASQVRVVLHVDGVDADGARLTDDALTLLLQTMVQLNPDVEVVVSSDPDVAWDRVVMMDDKIRTAGVTKIRTQ